MTNQNNKYSELSLARRAYVLYTIPNNTQSVKYRMAFQPCYRVNPGSRAPACPMWLVTGMDDSLIWGVPDPRDPVNIGWKILLLTALWQGYCKCSNIAYSIQTFQTSQVPKSVIEVIHTIIPDCTTLGGTKERKCKIDWCKQWFHTDAKGWYIWPRPTSGYYCVMS